MTSCEWSRDDVGAPDTLNLAQGRPVRRLRAGRSYSARRQVVASALSAARRSMFARHYLWTRSYDLAVVPRWEVDYLESSFLA
jgi:hypothetical protein